MIEIIIAILMSLATPEAVERLRSTAPSYLTTETARGHLVSATIAGLATQVDPALLLSIAHHESRFANNEVTRESGGRVSCGVMTPTPVSRCISRDLTGSYLDGARHLRGWIDACRGNMTCSLRGYGGGWRLVKFCAAGGNSRGCMLPQVFEARARWIQGPTPRKPSVRSAS